MAAIQGDNILPPIVWWWRVLKILDHISPYCSCQPCAGHSVMFYQLSCYSLGSVTLEICSIYIYIWILVSDQDDGSLILRNNCVYSEVELLDTDYTDCDLH